MIHLIGERSGREGDAALAVVDAVSRLWPDVADGGNRRDDVWVIVGAQVFGGEVKDLDLTVLVSLARPRRVISPRRRTLDEVSVTIGVQYLCVVIEVKDKSGSDVRFVGSNVEVRYDGGWKSATRQNRDQVYALRELVDNMGARPPFIHGVVWLRNVPATDVPRHPSNVLAGRVLAFDALIDACDVATPGRIGQATGPSDAAALRRVFDVLGSSREATELDRMRMNAIVGEAIRPPLADALGARQIILRGRGGSGKTATLLHLAFRAFGDRRAKVLVLSYNRALVADIRRQLNLLGVPLAILGAGIRVETVHAFFLRWLRSRQIDHPGAFVDANDGFDAAAYDAAVAEVSAWFAEGLLTDADVVAAKVESGGDLHWDLVCIDEAQDWPPTERDLLRHLYAPTSVVVADGLDQLIRASTACDWERGIPPDALVVANLPKCLRMKTALVDFANVFAEELGIDGWRLVPHEGVPGGRVIILEGDYFESPDLHRALRERNAAGRNRGIDMLLCVPPSMVDRRPGGAAVSRAARRLAGWGERVWDAVDDLERVRYPLDVEELRVVQYDSCRGLEGWIVVNLGFDDFFDYKRETWPGAHRSSTAGVAVDVERERLRFAGFWSMIPLTRAMDMLVINVAVKDSIVKLALEATRNRLPDLVEWRRPGSRHQTAHNQT